MNPRPSTRYHPHLNFKSFVKYLVQELTAAHTSHLLENCTNIITRYGAIVSVLGSHPHPHHPTIGGLVSFPIRHFFDFSSHHCVCHCHLFHVMYPLPSPPVICDHQRRSILFESSPHQLISPQIG